MTVFEADVDAALERLAALSLLTPDVRRLVEASFEPVAYTAGAAIVREGDPADAFYLLTAGTARVTKLAENGDEVSLNVLHAGDSFGETGLLDGRPRVATVRAATRVEALRLDGGVFSALARSHPEVRDMFAAVATERALWLFLRVHSSLGELPPETFAALAAGFERVEVEAGAVVIREGEPAGPLFVVEDGRLRAFRGGPSTNGGAELADLRKGDFFGERSLILGEPRYATVEAVTDSVLLRLPKTLLDRLVAEDASFRARLEEEVARYDYRRLARVPVDFAEEILPAEAAAQEKVSPRQVGEAALLPVSRRRTRRFPHVFQLDEADCGAASLAMVCRHFGRDVAVSRVREAVHTATDGTTLAGITRGAEELGLSAASVRVAGDRLDELPLPAIVHWEGNHWVVLYDVGEHHVRVADPARTTHRISRAEFLSHWSGYASVLAPTERLNETPEMRASLGWLVPFMRPHKKPLAIAVVLAVVAAGLALVLPILTEVVVDRVLERHDVNLLYVVVGTIAVVTVALTAAGLVQRYLLAKVAVVFDFESLDFVTGRLLDLPMRFFNTRRTGDIERRLEAVRYVRQFLVETGAQALTAITLLLASLVLMFVLNWTLALVYLATVPVYATLMWYSARRMRPMYDHLEEAFGHYQAAQIDAIRGIETVKATAAEPALRTMMLHQFRTLADRIYTSEFLVMLYQGALQLVTFVSLALFLFVGALEVVHGRMTLGQFVAFNALIAVANGPVLLLLALWDKFQVTRVQLGRLDDVLQHEPEQGRDRTSLREVTRLSGRVELRGVRFRYGGPESPLVLDDINLDVRPAESVAIVGRSGSGKTTLIKLLAGLLEPTEGTIFYDGVELHALDYRTLRRHVGFVLQESYLFNTTIAGNIGFGDAEPDVERVVWASRAANAHEFVQRLPLGYDTHVGDAGLRLSGGQQQRIVIARALYNRPPILLLDEATSQLDIESERVVKESLEQLLVDRNSFVISHRLSTIRNVDRIVVLERGRIAEQGTHDELMERQGLYFYLASQQLEL